MPNDTARLCEHALKYTTHHPTGKQYSSTTLRIQCSAVAASLSSEHLRRRRAVDAGEHVLALQGLLPRLGKHRGRISVTRTPLQTEKSYENTHVKHQQDPQDNLKDIGPAKVAQPKVEQCCYWTSSLAQWPSATARTCSLGKSPGRLGSRSVAASRRGSRASA